MRLFSFRFQLLECTCSSGRSLEGLNGSEVISYHCSGSTTSATVILNTLSNIKNSYIDSVLSHFPMQNLLKMSSNTVSDTTPLVSSAMCSTADSTWEHMIAASRLSTAHVNSSAHFLQNEKMLLARRKRKNLRRIAYCRSEPSSR